MWENGPTKLNFHFCNQAEGDFGGMLSKVNTENHLEKIRKKLEYCMKNRKITLNNIPN